MNHRWRDGCSRSIMSVSKVVLNMLCSSVVVVAAVCATEEVGVAADGMGGDLFSSLPPPLP